MQQVDAQLYVTDPQKYNYMFRKLNRAYKPFLGVQSYEELKTIVSYILFSNIQKMSELPAYKDKTRSQVIANVKGKAISLTNYNSFIGKLCLIDKLNTTLRQNEYNKLLLDDYKTELMHELAIIKALQQQNK